MKTSVDRRHVIRHGNRRDVVRAILHRVADADDAKCCLASSKCCLYRNSRHSSARYSVERQAMFKPDIAAGSRKTLSGNILGHHIKPFREVEMSSSQLQ